MKTKMTMKEYGMVAAVLCAVAVGFGGEVTFPLEWSARYDTSVPYEVEINAEKLEKLAGVPRGSGFAVTATTPGGMRRLDVAAYEGRFAGDVGLRFKVPSGTTALSCTAGVGRLRIERRAEGDLLADACADPSAWVCEAGATEIGRAHV